jgi:hypothetical protein
VQLLEHVGVHRLARRLVDAVERLDADVALAELTAPARLLLVLTADVLGLADAVIVSR